MNKLVIIGASGHGKVVADIANRCGYDQIVFLDDDESVKTCGRWCVIGKTDTAIDGDVVVAIGNAEIRQKIIARLKNNNIVTLVHPDAIVAQDTHIGKGTVVMAGAVVNPGAKIGEGCIINTSSSVDHDCIVGDYSHISVGAHLSGTVHVGEFTWVGAGVVVSNNIDICSSCIIGAGAVVIKDIVEPGTYVGIPARKLK